MRRLHVFESISIDGYFTDQNSDLGWARVSREDPEFASVHRWSDRQPTRHGLVRYSTRRRIAMTEGGAALGGEVGGRPLHRDAASPRSRRPAEARRQSHPWYHQAATRLMPTQATPASPINDATQASWLWAAAHSGKRHTPPTPMRHQPSARTSFQRLPVFSITCTVRRLCGVPETGYAQSGHVVARSDT